MKIEIIGSVASGKTTLAKHLSEKLQIPYYQKDNIVWERTPDGDKKRSAKERDRLFEKIISGDDWIVEGSPRKCLKESFACCDYIMLLDVSMMLRLKRVFSRWFRQLLVTGGSESRARSARLASGLAMRSMAACCSGSGSS